MCVGEPMVALNCVLVEEGDSDMTLCAGVAMAHYASCGLFILAMR